MTVFINSDGYLTNLVQEPDCRNTNTILSDRAEALKPLLTQSLGGIFSTNDSVWPYGIHVPSDFILPFPYEYVHQLIPEPVDQPLHPAPVAWAWEGTVTLDTEGYEVETESDFGYLWPEEIQLLDGIAANLGMDYPSLYPVYEVPLELMDESARRAYFKGLLESSSLEEEEVDPGWEVD